jgi:hypothetical protein
MTLGKMTHAEDYRRLAEEEAALAKLAVTNETRAQRYAVAAYYMHLAEAKEKLARMTKEATAGDSTYEG